MFIYGLIWTFVLGVVLGSFYNVCIYRIPREESIAFPASHCTTCNTKLKAIDLIPVFSYLFLGRKCRYCGEKISPRYAIVELLTGIIFAGIYIKYGLSFEFFKFIVMASFLIIIGFIDFDTTDVYSVTTISGIVCGVVFVIVGYLLGYDTDFKAYILGTLVAWLPIFIFRLFGAMGDGDPEICAMSGLFLGFTNSIAMLFFAFVIGGVIGIILILTGKKSRKDYIPFGPYIALGSIIAAVFGQYIIHIYLASFNL